MKLSVIAILLRCVTQADHGESQQPGELGVPADVGDGETVPGPEPDDRVGEVVLASLHPGEQAGVRGNTRRPERRAGACHYWRIRIRSGARWRGLRQPGGGSRSR
jgi:hypothetical protein